MKQIITYLKLTTIPLGLLEHADSKENIKNCNNYMN
jgi:hypothetical protein